VASPTGASVSAVRRMYLELASVGGNAPLRTIAEILLLVACPTMDPGRLVRWGDVADLQLMFERLASKDSAGARRAYLSHVQRRGMAQTKR